jgi:Acetyltransferase (GNAT) domain
MAHNFKARILLEDEYDLWFELTKEVTTTSLCSNPEYLSIVAQTTGRSYRILGIFQGDQLVGGTTLYETWLTFPKVAVALSTYPLLPYQGLVLREYITRYPSERVSRHLAILEVLIEQLEKLPYVNLALKIQYPLFDMRAFTNAGWTVEPEYTYIVSLTNLQNTWHRIEQNQRRLINRASKQGLVFTEDDDFDSLYRLHYDTYQRIGNTLYYSEQQYRKHFELLKEKNFCKLYQVRLDSGKSIAALLVLTGPYQATVTICAGTDLAYLNIGSSPFLRWKSFEALSQLGYATNDLLGASLNGATRFKSQLGGELTMNWIVARPQHPGYKIYNKLKKFANKGFNLVRS